jgi:hypothetical protein
LGQSNSIDRAHCVRVDRRRAVIEFKLALESGWVQSAVEQNILSGDVAGVDAA